MNNEPVFRLLFAAGLVINLSISSFYRRRADAQSEEDISPAEEGWLILNLRRFFGLAFWLALFLYPIRPSWLGWASVPLPDWARWGAGGLLVLVLPPLMVWLFSSLGKNVTPTVVTREKHTLVTSGPYRWVRHPLYTLGFFAWFLFGALAANWFFWAMTLAAIVLIGFRTPIEEAKLIDEHGDAYRAYMRRTGRYLPRLVS